MVKLYRHPADLQHWFVHIPGTGWARFPAKIDGWAEHQMVFEPGREHFTRVPLWLAFNTGLLEAVECRSPYRAA